MKNLRIVFSALIEAGTVYCLHLAAIIKLFWKKLPDGNKAALTFGLFFAFCGIMNMLIALFPEKPDDKVGYLLGAIFGLVSLIFIAYSLKPNLFSDETISESTEE